MFCWFGPLVDWMKSGLNLFSGIGSLSRVVTSLELCSLVIARLLCVGCGLSGSLGGPWLIWMHVS